jgi:small subunit ribosomal protein S20
MIRAVPNIKAAEKWVLQSEKRSLRNKGAKSRLRSLFKRAVEAAEPGSGRMVESAYDKAAAKGIIHPNKAARKKSRLAKAVLRSATAGAKPVKGRGSSTGRR